VELRDTKEALSLEVAAWLLEIFEEEHTVEEVSALSEDLCDKLRALALTALLVDANVNVFYHHLIRSARVRIHFLERCIAEHKLQHFRRACSRNEALLDSLTAGDFERANRIAELSPREWLSNAEYEEDYVYTQIIHQLLQGDSPSAENMAGLLAQFERALDGTPSARLSVSRALAARSQDDFDEAFEELLTEHDNELEAQRARSVMQEAISVSNQRVWIEGLGLLRLADKLDLGTASEYRYCPALARNPMTKPFPGE
jgi:hypothetical protein